MSSACCYCLDTLRPSTLHSSPSLSSSFSFSCSSSSSSMWVGSMGSPMRTSANEELGTLAENNPLTGYEPNFIDNYQISETTEIFIQESPATAGPEICMTWRSMTTPSVECSLHHCSLRSEKNQRAVDKLITLLKNICCQVSRCLSVMYERRDMLMSLVR